MRGEATVGRRRRSNDTDSTDWKMHFCSGTTEKIVYDIRLRKEKD